MTYISYNELIKYLEDIFDTRQHEDGLYNSSLSRITEAHTLLQTQSILEVAAIYLLNGRLGR